MKTLRITVNGTAYEVEVSDVKTSPIAVKVNGKDYDVTMEEQGAVQIAASPKPVAAKPAAPKPISPISTGVKVLRAPMPGTILDISVKAGDKVTRGQLICALEAMKMKNAIKSTVDGVIASVSVVSGQKVAYNDVIVSYE
jgi:biotin carboxyl carrier protein